MEGRSSDRPFLLRLKAADYRVGAVGSAMPGVRLGEGLDHHGAVMAGGVQDAVPVKHEAGVAVPRALARREPDNQIAPPRLRNRDADPQFGLLVGVTRRGAAARVESLLHQTTAIGSPGGAAAQSVRHAQKAPGDRDGVASEFADIGCVLIGCGDQGVERQVRIDGFDALGRKRRAFSEGGRSDPSHHAVPARAAPEAIAAAVEHIEGLAEDQLVNGMIAGRRVGVDVRDGGRAMHGPDRPEGRGAHNAFQRLIGQIGPGERGAGVQNGGGFSQAWARPVEPLS